MSALLIVPRSIVNGTVYGLPASKSVSNRVLILDALSGFSSDLKNLSEARDTSLMTDLVRSSEKEINEWTPAQRCVS